MTDLSAALAAFAPEIAESFANTVRSSFDHYVAKFGPALRGIYNAPEGRFFRGTIAALTVRSSDRGDATVSLDEGRLARAAAKYAEATIEEWRGKINAKLGELEGAEVIAMNGVAFQITGFRAGRRVLIEQQMVFKFSSKGTPFNQFPARIYLDGKFTPEAAYKRAFA